MLVEVEVYVFKVLESTPNKPESFYHYAIVSLQLVQQHLVPIHF